MKDLAKRFFSLLYLFLTRRYRECRGRVHSSHAPGEGGRRADLLPQPGDRRHGRLDGARGDGARSWTARYPSNQWNIYAAQASDGDNTSSDNAKTLALLTDVILPLCQYYAYLEVGPTIRFRAMPGTDRPSNLWRAYELIVGPQVPMAMRKVQHRRDIYPVFRELFDAKADARLHER